MVFYFYPLGYTEGSDDWLIYMGKDKFENEDLIRYGLDADIWFHVDDMSSAHVYLRLPEGGNVRNIPKDTLEDCCQLVKANSIQGCKAASVDIVYTLWSNLRKSKSMDVGQVGFRSEKEVLKYKVEKKKNEVVNRLEKTKKELYPDLAADKKAYESQVRGAKHAEEQAARDEAKAAKEEHKRTEEMKSYSNIMQDENMVSNKAMADKYASVEDYEDDFM